MKHDLDSVINDVLALQKDLKILRDHDKLTMSEHDYTEAQMLLAQAEFGMRAITVRASNYAKRRQELS